MERQGAGAKPGSGCHVQNLACRRRRRHAPVPGIELARRAAELDPDIKIMFITGFAAVALNSDSSAPKHAKVLSKPIHLRELVNEVQKLLAA
jgi:DNA-binding LytR/AlgR family response regulator